MATCRTFFGAFPVETLRTFSRSHGRAKIREVASKAKDGEVIAGGGAKPERLKSGWRPDLLLEKPDGSQYGINVGREAASAAPARREAEAINDLEGAGLPMRFVPYKP